jgi:hypothetical protein
MKMMIFDLFIGIVVLVGVFMMILGSKNLFKGCKKQGYFLVSMLLSNFKSKSKKN